MPIRFLKADESIIYLTIAILKTSVGIINKIRMVDVAKFVDIAYIRKL